MKRITIALLLIGFCMVACQSLRIQPPSEEFLTMLTGTDSTGRNKLRFDGVYHYIRPENYNHGTDLVEGKPTRYIDTPYVDQPVFFCHNGLMAYNNALYLDSDVYSYNMKYYGIQEDAFQNEWGLYTVRSDTVKATFYMTLANDKFVPVTQRTICHFEGVIQNDSTIRDWKLVPPYPKYGPQSDFEINDMKQARTLTFKSVPIQKWIDPNNAWINRFREPSTREPKN